jgi:hypothetical protein
MFCIFLSIDHFVLSYCMSWHLKYVTLLLLFVKNMKDRPKYCNFKKIRRKKTKLCSFIMEGLISKSDIF